MAFHPLAINQVVIIAGSHATDGLSLDCESFSSYRPKQARASYAAAGCRRLGTAACVKYLLVFRGHFQTRAVFPERVIFQITGCLFSKLHDVAELTLW